MTPTADEHMPAQSHHTGGLRLDTLIRLRWLAIAGQSAALVVVYLFLRFSLPLGLCLTAIGVSVLLNILLRLRYPASRRLSHTEALLFMAYDVGQLAALLYLTGGMLNPFAFLFLVPVVVCAASLPARFTIVLGLGVLLIAGLLARFHHPLPWYAGESFDAPPIYVAGMWLSLLASMVFMGIYAGRVAHEARQISDALTATELVLAREQHLSQIDGLAAAAAHELGTPLATIALVSKELERAMPKDCPHGEDIALLREQLQRCRVILARLTSLGTDNMAPFDRLTITHLVEEVVEPHRNFGVEIDVELDGVGDEPVHLRNAALLHSLGNLVENAVDFAREQVRIFAQWDDEMVRIEISDDGPGFSGEVIDRLGEPYVSTRGHDNRRGGASDNSFGMGLGFFIARTLLQRTGARVSFENIPLPGHGARITVLWPRSALDTARDLRLVASSGMAAINVS